MRTCGRSLLREKHSWWLFFFLPCVILVPLPGIKAIPPALGVWGLNHWPTSEVPKEPHFSLQMEKGKERKCTQGNSPGLWRWTERVVYFSISHTNGGLHVSLFFTHTHTQLCAFSFLTQHTHTQGCVFFYFSHIHIHTQRAVCFPVSHTHRYTPHTHTHHWWKGPNLACAGKLAAYSIVKNSQYFNCPI